MSNHNSGGNHKPIPSRLFLPPGVEAQRAKQEWVQRALYWCPVAGAQEAQEGTQAQQRPSPVPIQVPVQRGGIMSTQTVHPPTLWITCPFCGGDHMLGLTFCEKPLPDTAKLAATEPEPCPGEEGHKAPTVPETPKEGA
jgi:hypothetical protein